MRCAREAPVARERLALAVLLASAVALGASHSARAADPSVRLLGTVVSSEAPRSLAVIELGGRQRVVRTGGDVGGATVVEIHSESLLLRRGDRLETLELAGPTRATVTAVSSNPASPATDDAPAAALAAAHAPGPAAPSTARWRRPARPPAASAPARDAAPRSEGEVARSNDELMANLASQARFAAVNDDNGKLRGVAVMNIASDSMIERLGLRSDDVIVKIQNTPIDSSGRAMQVARSLDRSQPVRLDIERRGVPTVVMVDPRAIQGR
jgi:type II secretion system protein C